MTELVLEVGIIMRLMGKVSDLCQERRVMWGGNLVGMWRSVMVN
jgi:hypothetical protein